MLQLPLINHYCKRAAAQIQATAIEGQLGLNGGGNTRRCSLGGRDFPQEQADVLDTLVDRCLGEQALLQAGGKGQGMSNDVGQDTQRNPFFQQLREVVIELLMTFEDLPEQADQLGSRGLLGLGGGHVLEDLNLGRAIEFAGLDLAAHADTFPAQEQDVEAAIGQTLVLNDLAQTSDFLEWRRLGPGLSLGKRTDLDHRDQPIAGQGVLGHLAVARLENMERKDDVRERDEVGQREQPGDLAKVSQVEIVIHIHLCIAGLFSRDRERPSGGERAHGLNIVHGAKGKRMDRRLPGSEAAESLSVRPA